MDISCLDMGTLSQNSLQLFRSPIRVVYSPTLSSYPFLPHKISIRRQFPISLMPNMFFSRGGKYKYNVRRFARIDVLHVICRERARWISVGSEKRNQKKNQKKENEKELERKPLISPQIWELSIYCFVSLYELGTRWAGTALLKNWANQTSMKQL